MPRRHTAPGFNGLNGSACKRLEEELHQARDRWMERSAFHRDYRYPTANPPSEPNPFKPYVR